VNACGTEVIGGWSRNSWEFDNKTSDDITLMINSSLRRVFPAVLVGLLGLGWQTACGSVRPSNHLMPAFVPATAQTGVVSFIPRYRFRPLVAGRLPGMDRGRVQYQRGSRFAYAERDRGWNIPRSVMPSFFKPAYRDPQRFRPLAGPKTPVASPYPAGAAGLMPGAAASAYAPYPYAMSYAGRLKKPWVYPRISPYRPYSPARHPLSYPSALPMRPAALPSIAHLQPRPGYLPSRYASGRFRFRPETQTGRYPPVQPFMNPSRNWRLAAASGYRFRPMPPPSISGWNRNGSMYPAMAQLLHRPFTPPPVYRFRPDPRLPLAAGMVYRGPIPGFQQPDAVRFQRSIKNHEPVWRPLDDQLAQRSAYASGMVEQQDWQMSAFPRGTQLAN